MNFLGYERPNGSVGVRNYVAVLPSVVCVNDIAVRIANQVKGSVALCHHQGCVQMGADLEQTTRTLIGFGANPNVAAVLVVSLGCEGVPAEELTEEIAKSGKPVEMICLQEIGSSIETIEKGVRAARKMAQYASKLKRRPTDLSRLTIGIKCGSSDATSGISANPATGAAADMAIESGCTVIFGETTELMGAEHILARRAVNKEVARRIYDIVKRMERLGMSMGVDMRGSQPTPGNIKGGLTTIEEKSLGAILKAGSSTIQGVLEYAHPPKGRGCFIMDSPGREIEVLSGFVAGGAQMILFTTGRGVPMGLPIAPVIKISGNPKTCKKMADDIDVDVSAIIEKGEPIEDAGKRIFKEILSVASGKVTKAEAMGYGVVDIYRIGPTL